MLLSRLLRFFFHWLYQPLAFAYDLVAAAVSFGRWNDWVHSVMPFVQGRRILELGHGPGHLLPTLREGSRQVIGLDESSQMGRLAAQRLRSRGIGPSGLVRGVSQLLPFAPASFDTIVSTFPSEYIFDGRTLNEVRRVLSPQGRLVILPAAWPRVRLLAWLFKVTGEAPSVGLEALEERILPPFMKAGFRVESRVVQLPSSTVLLLLAEPLEN